MHRAGLDLGIGEIITRCAPGIEDPCEHEQRFSAPGDHGAIRQGSPIVEHCVRCAALRVQADIHLVSSRNMGPAVAACESLTESHRIRVAAFEARAMSRRKRRRLVEEKKFGITVAENLSPAALEAELATDPASRGKTPLPEREGERIVKAPSPIAEHRPPFRRRDDLAERRHPVLQRHGVAKWSGRRSQAISNEKSRSAGFTAAGPSP